MQFPAFHKMLLVALTLCLLFAEGFVSQKVQATTENKTLLKMGVRSTLAKPFKKVFGSSERTDKELKDGIAGFYDASSGVWEDVWGEHMHHGYYPEGVKVDHKEAQIDMINRSLDWAGVVKADNVVDVGCGIGGSSRHIARRYGGRTTGITLSPVQAARATALSEAQGLGDRCRFQVADALNMPFEENSFDLIWSMESGEHMPEKEKFVQGLARVCAPGGKVLVVTWCHRDLEPGEAGLTPKEERLLNRINKAYYLPRWCSVADYVAYAEAAGLADIKTADWTDRIQAFWPAVVRSALGSPRNFWGMLRSGPKTVRGALAMLWMIQGYNRGLIKFGLITATKPASAADEQKEDPKGET
mmetsp:Transcript_25030/g.39585  ORF Transcript_25030/g.39585 Transcript_25030/m.39585 type:complete len:358 (+) Transcript_25030:71-1144(+)